MLPHMFIMSICTAGIDVKKVENCVGDPDANEENPVLKGEQDAQVLEKTSVSP